MPAHFPSLDELARQAEQTLAAAEQFGGEILKEAHRTLETLRQPVIHTTLDAMHKLEQWEAAIVNRLAVALLDAGTKRPKLIAEVRAAMDKVSV